MTEKRAAARASRKSYIQTIKSGLFYDDRNGQISCKCLEMEKSALFDSQSLQMEGRHWFYVFNI